MGDFAWDSREVTMRLSWPSCLVNCDSEHAPSDDEEDGTAAEELEEVGTKVAFLC